jgi:hypothetical protein
METIDPAFLGTAAVTAGIGVAMVWLGSRLNMLERRHAERRCPSCGRVAGPRGGCGCTG